MSANTDQLSSVLTQYNWKSFIPATEQYPDGFLGATFSPDGNLSLTAGGNIIGAQWVVTDDGKLQTQNMFTTEMAPPEHIAKREGLLAIVFSPDETIPIQIVNEMCPHINPSGNDGDKNDGVADPSVVLRVRDLTFCGVTKNTHQ